MLIAQPIRTIQHVLGSALLGFGLSPAEGARRDRRPGIHRHEAAHEFKDKTTAPNQLWRTDVTYLR
jgi:hypothetical protein